MRNSKLNYLIVGSFVIAMIIGMIVSIALLTGRTGATDSYYAIYRNVTGVKFGTQVLYEGYPIGQVEEVTPVAEGAKMSFKVDFTVNQGWRIPEDSVAKIAAPGLLSAITLSISAGKSENMLSQGAQVHGLENADMFAVVSSLADEIGLLAQDDIRPLLKTVNKAVASFGALLDEDGKVLIGDLAALVRDISGKVPTIAGNLEEITQKVNRSSDELGKILTPENREKIESLIANMDQAAINFTELSSNLDGLIENLDKVVADNSGSIQASTADMRYIVESVARHIDALNQNMEATSRNMYEFSRQIRQNPGLLLGGTPPRDEAAGRK